MPKQQNKPEYIYDWKTIPEHIHDVGKKRMGEEASPAAPQRNGLYNGRAIYADKEFVVMESLADNYYIAHRREDFTISDKQLRNTLSRHGNKNRHMEIAYEDGKGIAKPWSPEQKQELDNEASGKTQRIRSAKSTTERDDATGKPEPDGRKEPRISEPEGGEIWQRGHPPREEPKPGRSVPISAVPYSENAYQFDERRPPKEFFSAEEKNNATRAIEKEFLNRNGESFYYRDRHGSRLAFMDRGDVIKTGTNDPDVAKAMAWQAITKGWAAIEIKGHRDFRQSVWLEASVQGVEVTGYKPTQHDLDTLRNRQEKLLTNEIKPGQIIEPGTPTRVDPTLTPAMLNQDAKVQPLFQVLAQQVLESRPQTTVAELQNIYNAVQQQIGQFEKTGMVPNLEYYDVSAAPKTQQEFAQEKVQQQTQELAR